MGLLQAVVIGLTALIIAPGWFFYFDVTPKLAVLLAGVGIAVLVCGGSRPARPWTLALMASAIWLAVASALSVNPAFSVFGSTWRRFGAVAQLAVLLMAWLVARNDDRGRITVLRGIAAASTLAAIYGIAQYFGHDPLLPAAAYHIGEGLWTIVRPPGTLGYVSYFATVLLMGGFLSLAWAAAETNRLLRLLAYSSAAICLVAMALTGTRAALLGLVAGGAVAAWMHGFRLSRRALAAGGIALVLGIAFYFSGSGWGLRSRARWFREDPWGGARPLLWRDSLRMGMARPFAGFGPEVFTAAFPQFESRDLARAYPDFAHESPHNIFLDALVSEGLPGFACLAAVCIIGLAAAWRSGKPWMGAALVGGLAAQQFTSFTIPTALITYAAVALCVPREEPAKARAAVWQIRLAASPAAAVMLYLAFRYAVADRALELARHDLAAGDVPRAEAHFRAYQRDRLPGASADLWYARTLEALAHKADPLRRMQIVWMAGKAALDATRTADDPFNAWYNMAEVYAAANDASHTENSLRRAIAGNPNWFKPHWTLAQVLRVEGRDRESADEAATAADLDAGKHPEVDQTLAEIRALHR